MKPSDKDKLNILYLDNHLVVVEKEKGLLTQPSPVVNKSLETLVKEYLKQKENKKSIYLHAVHRLDKEVSGIVVFAKSQKALSRLNKQMREKGFEKVYFATVEGQVTENNSLKDYLIHGSHKAKVVSKNTKGAKLCELDFKVIKSNKTTSLLEIHLITGRYHQIRCQLAYLGHPIVGDTKYGAKPRKQKGIELHQGKISFTHPTLKKRLEFQV